MVLKQVLAELREIKKEIHEINEIMDSLYLKRYSIVKNSDGTKKKVPIDREAALAKLRK